MPSSSVFKKFMFRALYRMIRNSDWNMIGKKSLNVSNVKLLSLFRSFFFNVLCLFVSSFNQRYPFAGFLPFIA